MVTCQEHMGKYEVSKPIVVVKQHALNRSDILKPCLVRDECWLA